jgi:FkbM family methyltransferase
MRILIHSNASEGSGYGGQTWLLASRLPGLGHEAVISPTHGADGRPATRDGTLILPSGMRAYSNDTLAPHARRVFGGDPGLILILYDAWAIDPVPLRPYATALWAPIQSHPVPPKDLDFFRVSRALPIAMSRYGERELAAAGLQPVYVPHAVDTTVFRPLSADERAAAREALHIPPGAFTVAIVAANKDKTPPRKGWGEQLAAFARFRERHGDAVLLIHTMWDTDTGVKLLPLVADLGLQDAVQFTGQYEQVTGLYGPGDVAAIMGCADVLSNCSWAEGFGLPVLEAQACGTPVVVSDGSAMTEMCGSGWRVECQPYWHPFAESWWHCPGVDGITDAYEQAYEQARDPQVRAKAREFALAYDADTVADWYWKPALEMLEQYAGAVPVRPPGRNHGTVPLPTAEADGLRWIQRGGITDDWIATGHEEALAPVLDGLLPGGGVLLDVGAHVGRWALRLAGKASRVIAVEANPATAAVLRAHIELNDVTNVDVIEAAAWDSQARLALADPPGRVTSGSVRVTESADGTIPAVPLDDLLAVVPQIDLIKLDVEGADLHALRGMAGTLARLRPVLLIEDHSIYGYYDLDDLKALLTSLGYGYEEITVAVSPGAVGPYLIARPQQEEAGQDG